jgi:hypothetical protein
VHHRQHGGARLEPALHHAAGAIEHHQQAAGDLLAVLGRAALLVVEGPLVLRLLDPGELTAAARAWRDVVGRAAFAAGRTSADERGAGGAEDCDAELHEGRVSMVHGGATLAIPMPSPLPLPLRPFAPPAASSSPTAAKWPCG